jgi:hypothetical protein
VALLVVTTPDTAPTSVTVVSGGPFRLKLPVATLSVITELTFTLASTESVLGGGGRGREAGGADKGRGGGRGHHGASDEPDLAPAAVRRRDRERGGALS